jgi:PAS domain S-box-containing protein
VEIWRHSSDYKRNLELLHNERDRFEAALRSTNLITYTWNLENDVIAAEDRLFELLGYDPERLRTISATQYSQFFHPEDLGRMADEFQAYLSGETDSFAIKTRMVHKDGHPITSKRSINPPPNQG